MPEGAVQFYVKKQSELLRQINKLLNFSTLHFVLSTACARCIAPIVCVDFYERSVKVISVDG
jgi:hypothetical protein